MTIKVERLPGESIIYISVHEPMDPRRDMAALFPQIVALRQTMPPQVVMVIDLGGSLHTPDAFSQMVLALAEASHGVRASRASGLPSAPTTIFVGSGIVAEVAAQSMAQEQYGGVGGSLCATLDEAYALARAKLASVAS